MSLFRVALLTTAAVFVLPPSHANAQPKAEPTIEARFLGGTVKTIPIETAGTLSFKDAQELRFQYLGAVYHLPYGQIVDTEIQDPNNRGHWVVHVPWQKRFETLVISYHDSNGVVNTLNFQLSSRVADVAERAVSIRRNASGSSQCRPGQLLGRQSLEDCPHARVLGSAQQKPATAALAVGGTK